MPRVTKDAIENEEKKVKKSSSSVNSKKRATSKNTATKTAKPKTSTSSKTSNKKNNNSKTKKTTTSKSTKSSSVATKKKNTTKSSTTKRKSSHSKVKKLETPILAEYYDLPYRYNQTVVKILYQTPKILFVYWDISDDDRLKLIQQYGENFFNESKPILKIHNTTMNYSFEIEINDFANSWYIHVNDANCHYLVELGRRPIINYNASYIPISYSNNIESPNDHILFEKLPKKIEFRNVKTQKVSYKGIGSLRLIAIDKIFSIHEFYRNLYQDEILEELNNNKMINPSSSSWK